MAVAMSQTHYDILAAMVGAGPNVAGHPLIVLQLDDVPKVAGGTETLYFGTDEYDGAPSDVPGVLVPPNVQFTFLSRAQFTEQTPLGSGVFVGGGGGGPRTARRPGGPVTPTEPTAPGGRPGQLGELFRSSPLQVGQAVILNEAGALDALRNTYVFRGVTGSLLVGSTGLAWASFGAMLSVRVAREPKIEWGEGRDRLTLELKPGLFDPELPALTTYFSGISEELDGTPIPVLYGVRRNFTPVRTGRYEWTISDPAFGALQELIEVREGNYPLADVTADLANGKFTLGHDVSLPITCSAKGAKFNAGAYADGQFDIAKQILVGHAGLTSGQVTGSTGGNSSGVYIRGGMTILQALETILRPRMVWMPSQMGTSVALGTISLAGSPTGNVYDRDNIASVSVESADPLASEVWLGYQTYDDLVTSSFGAVTEADALAYASPARYKKGTVASPLPGAYPVEILTPYDDATEAQTEATALATLFKVRRSVFALDGVKSNIMAEWPLNDIDIDEASLFEGETKRPVVVTGIAARFSAEPPSVAIEAWG